jgi:DNA-binding MarR family transcriptional regulator
MRLDPMVHAPVRLAILSMLATVDNASFSFLKESVGTTDGNLSTHLTKLEANGYVVIEKTFKDKKPHTICSITEKGRTSFLRYLEEIDRIVQDQRREKE